MPIETLNIKSSASTLNDLSNKVGGPKTLQDQFVNKPSDKEDDDKKAEDKKKETDRVQLSREAQQFLKSGDSRSSGDDSKKDVLAEAAIELRGLNQISQRRDLTPQESDRQQQITDKFAEIGLNKEGVVRIADKKLAEFQQELPDLVQLAQDNQITGSQFKKLNKINELLNRSNGFAEDVNSTDAAKVTNLSKQFNTLVEQTKDQKLSRDQVSNLDKLQKELSTIQGFRLNVRESIGPDGVVV
jgi:hypothetical protein